MSSNIHKAFRKIKQFVLKIQSPGMPIKGDLSGHLCATKDREKIKDLLEMGLLRFEFIPRSSSVESVILNAAVLGGAA